MCCARSSKPSAMTSVIACQPSNLNQPKQNKKEKKGMPFFTTPVALFKARRTKQHSKRTKHFSESSRVNLTNSDFLKVIKENWAFAQYTLRRNQVEAVLNDPQILKLDIATIDRIVKLIESDNK